MQLAKWDIELNDLIIHHFILFRVKCESERILKIGQSGPVIDELLQKMWWPTFLTDDVVVWQKRTELYWWQL